MEVLGMLLLQSPDDRLLSVREAAKLVNVHYETMRVWVRDGEVPAFTIVGVRRIRESDLLKLATAV
jgi:excisionase family DNA binding protein